jgi:hypothetical protein
MKPELIRFAILVALCATGGAVLQGQAVNADAQLIGDFQTRVKRYAAMRDGQEQGAARLKTTKDPAQITAAQQALAAKIRAQRPQAQHGDIFTPAAQPLFRRLLAPALKGRDGVENKAALKEDNPGPVTLKVNGTYPEKEPLSTVPPDILQSLPPLPEDLDYRFAGKHLILYDARANLIVDFIPNALP